LDVLAYETKCWIWITYVKYAPIYTLVILNYTMNPKVVEGYYFTASFWEYTVRIIQ
jgi:hypothetical protein